MLASHASSNIRTVLGLLVLAFLLAACSGPRKGGYYQDDGPGSNIPASVAAVPDAVPRIERHAPANFRPYEVFGKTYRPIAENQAYRQSGVASWYGRKFHGSRTANGEIYDMYAMSAAHPVLPLPSYALVTREDTGRSVIVRVNDRGPFHAGRIIDLSYTAAAKLGLIGPGSGRVSVQAITNADIRAGRIPRPGGSSPQLAAQPQAPKPAAFSPPPAAPSGAFFLQFGAFATAENALSLAERVNLQLEGISLPAKVLHQPPFYKVRSGPFGSRAQASRDAELLGQAAGLNPVLAIE